MKELMCEVHECSVTLSTPTMLATGLCSRHWKMLEGTVYDYYYATVCWQCNQIHQIARAPFQGDPDNTDKLIMIESCPKCHKLSSGEEWMNHPKADALSKVVLGSEMTIHCTGMTTGKPISLKLRRTQATEVSGEKGHEIISKIKVSRAEADKRLNTFLSNLDLDNEEDHGR